jgi:hypothetical protein
MGPGIGRALLAHILFRSCLAGRIGVRLNEMADRLERPRADRERRRQRFEGEPNRARLEAAGAPASLAFLQPRLTSSCAEFVATAHPVSESRAGKGEHQPVSARAPSE